MLLFFPPIVDTPAATTASAVEVRIEAQLHGNNQRMIQAHGIAELQASSAVDYSGNDHPITPHGTQAVAESLMEFGNGIGLADVFDGQTTYWDCGDICDFSSTNPFRVEGWFKIDVAPAGFHYTIASKRDTDGSGDQGWDVSILTPSKLVGFTRYLNGTPKMALSPMAVSLGVRHHFIAEFNGSSSRVILDGLAGASVADTQAMVNHSVSLHIGALSTSPSSSVWYFKGQLQDVSFVGASISSSEDLLAFPLTATEIAEHYAEGWSDLSPDVLSAPGIRIRYGIEGSGPIDCVASPGECTFSLNNSILNSAGLNGYYSPGHANARDGWGLGNGLRARFIHNGVTYTKFRGSVGVIRPVAGRHGARSVEVVAYDVMHRLLLAGLREVPILIGEDDRTAILLAIGQALYSDDPALSLLNPDAAYESYPYVFDAIPKRAPAISALHDLVLSGLGLLFSTGGGNLTWQNRNTRAGQTTVVTLDEAMHDLDVVYDAEQQFTNVEVTIHPRSVGSTPIVLYQHPLDAQALVIFPNETRVFDVDFRDPDQLSIIIGGTDIIDPVSGTDYAGNALPNGSGTNLTGSLTVGVEEFASFARVTIVNAAAQDVYLVNGSGQNLFRIRGTPIYAQQDAVYQDSVTSGVGERMVPVDLPYQASATVAQAMATYIRQQYSDPNPLRGVSFAGSRSNALMAAAFGIEPGMKIAVTESQTGMAARTAIVHSVELEVGQTAVWCRWGCGPVAAGLIAPPPPASQPGGGGVVPVDDLIVTYTGAAAGQHNLTTGGVLALTTPGDYALTFSRLGSEIRVKGVAGGSVGGDGSAVDAGGAGGPGGASNLTGVVVPLTALHYSAKVGGPGGYAIPTTTEFRETDGTISLQLVDDEAIVGASGVAGGAGGTAGTSGSPPGNGASNVTGGGGGGSVGPDDAGDGGSGLSQTGGTGGDGATGQRGGLPTPSGTGQAQGGESQQLVESPPAATGAGGGAGGGVWVAGVFAGGGGGGAAWGSGVGTGGAGGQGVLTLEIEP